MKKSSGTYHTSIFQDKSSNLLFIEVNPDKIVKAKFGNEKKVLDTSACCNILIYNPTSNEQSYFFDPTDDRRIQYFLFETNYDKSEKLIQYNSYDSRGVVINNYKHEERQPANKLLIVATKKGVGKGRETEKGGIDLEFWRSTKKGENKELITTTPSYTDWRLDVKNQKILFIHRSINNIKVESFDW